MDPQQPNTMPPQMSSQPSPNQPQDKKKLFVIIAIIAAIIIIGGIAYAMTMGGKKDDTNSSANGSPSTSNNQSSSADSDKYQKYEVTDAPSGVSFTVSFYKDAKVEEKNGRTFLNAGEQGAMSSVYLGVAEGDTIDCGESPTTTMRLAGESTTICYKPDNTQYAGYAHTGSGMVKVNLAGQNAISMEEAKAIMESIAF